MKVKNEPDQKLKEVQRAWRGTYIGGQTADRKKTATLTATLITGTEKIDEKLYGYSAPKIAESDRGEFL